MPDKLPRQGKKKTIITALEVATSWQRDQHSLKANFANSKVQVYYKTVSSNNTIYLFLQFSCHFEKTWCLLSIVDLKSPKGPSIKDVSPNFRFLGFPPSPCLLKSTI